MNRASVLIQRSRPRFWLYLAGPVLVGLVFGADSLDELTSPVAIGLFLYFLLPANVVLYGVNDVFDADIDRFNPKKFSREYRYRGDTLTILAIAISLLLALVGAIWIPLDALWWFGGFFVLAIAYSAPPIRFKTTPLFDSLSNGLYILPGVGAYVVIAGQLPPLEIIVGAWLWTMAMHTYSAIPDIEPDITAGIHTTATMLGVTGALGYCLIVWLAAAIAFALVDFRAGLLLSVYPMLIGVVASNRVGVERAYWWYPVINAIVGMVFTLYGLWVITLG